MIVKSFERYVFERYTYKITCSINHLNLFGKLLAPCAFVCIYIGIYIYSLKNKAKTRVELKSGNSIKYRGSLIGKTWGYVKIIFVDKSKWEGSRMKELTLKWESQRTDKNVKI
jgi:hypothetical protein